MSDKRLYKINRIDLDSVYECVDINLIDLIFGKDIADCCISLDVGDMYGEEGVEITRTK